MTNFYEALSISKTANADEIKSAYKRLAVKYHPDKNQNDNGAEERFKQINEAYQTLSDPIKKANYDYVLTYGFEPPIQEAPNYRARNYYRSEEVRPAPRKLNFLYLYIFVGFALFIVLGFYFFSYMEQKAARSIYADAERLYFEEQNSQAALKYLQLALEKDETLAPAYFLTGKIIFNEAQDYTTSLYYFENAVLEGNGVEDSIGSYYYWRGKNRLALDDYIGGVNDLEAAYAYMPQNINLILLIADTYLYKLNQYENSLFYYDQVLFSDPQHFDALLGKGVTLQKKMTYSEAALYLENASSIKPEAGEVYYYMAIQALNYQKDTSAACAYWQKASTLGVKEAIVQSKIYCVSPTP